MPKFCFILRFFVSKPLRNTANTEELIRRRQTPKHPFFVPVFTLSFIRFATAFRIKNRDTEQLCGKVLWLYSYLFQD
ncbi:hypothetical protein HQ39_04870 [Porphyromonas sp. COT-108 OH2963]|nr:hypothetical protein HQ39_04870 [Porphyromonas sp. COT-108 OH2963]